MITYELHYIAEDTECVLKYEHLRGALTGFFDLIRYRPELVGVTTTRYRPGWAQREVIETTRELVP